MSRSPFIFDLLRWLLEGGFTGHRKLIARSISSRARVLDCGCGTGIYASCFDAAHYFGIDISPIYIRRARAMCPGHRFEVMDATALQLESESFDAVMISGVLHHMDASTVERTIDEACRVLKPTGTLLVWEDIPTRHALNVIGRIVHRLDVGQYIRTSDGYGRLLAARCHVLSSEPFRSGFMDYASFICRKHNATASTAVENTAATTSDTPCEYVK